MILQNKNVCDILLKCRPETTEHLHVTNPNLTPIDPYFIPNMNECESHGSLFHLLPLKQIDHGDL